MQDSCFSLGSHGTVPRFPLGQIALMHGAGGSGSGSWQLLGGRAPLVPFPLHQACWYSPVGLGQASCRQDGESSLLFWLHYGTAHCFVSEACSFCGCAYVQAPKRQTEDNRNLEACLRARPLCWWFWSLWLLLARIKCKQFRFFFHFFTFLIFTELPWNLFSNTYLFLTVVYKQVCYSFSLHTAFHFPVLSPLNHHFLVQCYTSVNATNSKIQTGTRAKKTRLLVKSNSKTFGI